MGTFIHWLLENWLTIVSIVLSGLLSLVISAAYYHKGNRNNLQMTMLFPIVRLLNDSYSYSNYKSLCDLSENYCVRYLKKKERNALIELVSAYKEVSNYKEINVNADSLRSYFEYTLKRNEIEIKYIPIEYEGEVVCYEYPENYRYMNVDLQDILKKHPIEIEAYECEEAIVSIYSYYCKEYFSDKKIEYFKDYSLDEVLEKSHIQREWNNKFESMKIAKEKFLALDIIKDFVS